MSRDISIEDKSLLVGFGLSVRKARLSKNLSQDTLAELSGLHRTYVSSIERGERNVSLINMVNISKALDIPLCDLIEGI